MQISRNDWTPLFAELKHRISPMQKRVLLSRMIGGIQEITQGTMGKGGTNRPEPWPILKKTYADKWKSGDREPTLLMSDADHSLRNPDLPHLIDSFVATVSDNQATLTNVSPYADIHQEGFFNVPARPYYPINSDGSLTGVAEERMKEIVADYFQPNLP